MADQIWYRAEAKNYSAAKPQGHVHDFADGLYLSDSEETVKNRYAPMRAESGKANDSVIKRVNFDIHKMGRVLDLRNNAQWSKFLDSKMSGAMTYRQFLMGNVSSEQYNGVFKLFLWQHKLDLKNYDAVIGPDFISAKRAGGKIQGAIPNQLCILFNEGRGVRLEQRIREMLKVAPPKVTRGGVKIMTIGDVSKKMGRRKFVSSGRLSSRGKGILGALLAMIAESWIMGKLSQSQNEKRIKQLEPEIEKRIMAQILDAAAIQAAGSEPFANVALKITQIESIDASSDDIVMSLPGVSLHSVTIRGQKFEGQGERTAKKEGFMQTVHTQLHYFSVSMKLPPEAMEIYTAYRQTLDDYEELLRARPRFLTHQEEQQLRREYAAIKAELLAIMQGRERPANNSPNSADELLEAARVNEHRNEIDGTYSAAP